MLDRFPAAHILLLAAVCLVFLKTPSAADKDDRVVTTYRLTDFMDLGASRITSLRGDTGSSAFRDQVLTCDFGGRPGYIGISPGLAPLPGNVSEVALTFESDKSGHPIVLRFHDSAGQYFQRPIDTLDEDGLKTVRVPLADMGSWFHFGGQDDGIVRPPIKVAEIIVDHDGADTSIRLVELTATTEIQVEEGIILRLADRKVLGRCEILTLECRNILPRAIEAHLASQVTDFFGEELSASDYSFHLPPGGAAERTVSVPRRDVRLCEFRLSAEISLDEMRGEKPPKPLKKRTAPVPIPPDTVHIVKTVSTSVVRPFAHGGSTELVSDSPFGMGIYLGQRYPSAEMENPAKMAQEIGVKWMRDEFNWGHIEPERGRRNWERFDTAVDTAQKHGISIFGLLCYWTSWTKPYTEDGIRDYCNYVRAVVGRYKDRVKYWEIWNEPNIFFWGGTVEQYADLLKAAHDAVKEADPDAKVIGCCTAGTDLGFIERIFQLGCFDKMDILSIHPYRYPPIPEETDYIGELRRADALMREYGAPKEIWITEIGWPTNVGSNGSSEAKQAAMIVRSYIQAIASGVVQKIFWYDYRNDGYDITYNEHNFGIIRRDLSLKPAYAAFGTMTRCLEGKKFVKALDAPERVYAYLFEGDSGRTIAVWSVSGMSTMSMSCKSAPVTITNLAGARKTKRPLRDTVTVHLCEYPVFVEGVPPNPEGKVESVKPAKRAEHKIEPPMVTISPLDASRFMVELAAPSPLKDGVNAAIRIPGYADAFRLPRGTRDHAERYDLPQGLSLGAEKGLPVKVTVDTGKTIVKKRSNVYYVPCPRVSGRIAIDGRLDEWNFGPPVSLGKPRHFQELDPEKWRGPDDLSAEIWTAWDDSNFYLAAKVKDDAFCQTRSGGDMWQGDSIQFALDPLHLEPSAAGGIHEIGLAQTPEGVQVYRWFAPKGCSTALIKDAKLVVERKGHSTIYEVSIPLSELAPLKPEPRRTVGFSILINDDDGDGRKGWLEWSSGIGRGKLPNLYGDITFVE